MAEGYMSQVECAGGCGMLLAQHLVDRGRRFLWGHKGGCPREGDPPRRRHKGVRTPKPAQAVVASYWLMLEMACEELEAQRDAMLQQSGALLATAEELSQRMEQLSAARKALKSLVDAEANERKGEG